MSWDPRCGTEAGEKAHRRRFEPICDACRRGAWLARRARKLRAQGGPRPHHDSHCPGCGCFLKMTPSYRVCVNSACEKDQLIEMGEAI